MRDNLKTKMLKKKAIEQKILENKKRDIWTTVLKNSAPGKKKSNAQTNQEEANRMKKRSEFNAMIDTHYADGKLNIQGNAQIAEVGSDRWVTCELLVNTKPTNMTKQELMEVLRHFTRYSYIFQKLKAYVLQDLASRNKLTSQVETGIKNIFLDEAFLMKILSGATKMVDQIVYVRDSQGDETSLYYIFEGSVIVSNAESRVHMTTLEPE